MTSGRAQSNLIGVAVALVVVTVAATLGLTLADAAFADADRPSEQRRVAMSLSERFVAPDSPATTRANVLNGTVTSALDATWVDRSFPVVGNRSFRIRLGERTVAVRGEPTGGSTVRRIVLVRNSTAVTRSPAMDPDDPAATLPRRTSAVQLRIDPPGGTTVRTVRANDRVVLHDDSGLDGTYEVDLSRFETVRLRFEAAGPLPPGSVALTYYPETTRKSLLEVTVGE